MKAKFYTDRDKSRDLSNPQIIDHSKLSRVLEHKATRGGKYEIKMIRLADGMISLYAYTNGRQTWASCNYPNRDLAYARFAKACNEARTFNKINYCVDMKGAQ